MPTNAQREQQRFVDCDPELLAGMIEQLITHFAFKTGVTLCFRDNSRLVLEVQQCGGTLRLNFAKPFEAVQYRKQTVSPESRQQVEQLKADELKKLYAPTPSDIRDKESE